MSVDEQDGGRGYVDDSLTEKTKLCASVQAEFRPSLKQNQKPCLPQLTWCIRVSSFWSRQ